MPESKKHSTIYIVRNVNDVESSPTSDRFENYHNPYIMRTNAKIKEKIMIILGKH